MNKEDYYYLFGQSVVDAYNDGGLEDVIEQIRKGECFSTYHWNSIDNTPNDLLNEADGFFAFTELDKLEYDTLQKSITEL